MRTAKRAVEHLIGGKADGKPDTAFDPKALKKGRNVETEHSSSHNMATEIAKDHLEEDPNYYEKLEKMEKKSMDYVKKAAMRLKVAVNVPSSSAARAALSKREWAMAAKNAPKPSSKLQLPKEHKGMWEAAKTPGAGYPPKPKE